MDYKNTLNLPKTDLPMKAHLSEEEPKRLQKFKEMNIYHEIREKRKNSPKYVLHDGPPYANGNIHIGTALNKILKDFVIKIKTCEGYLSPYTPGWDCHGLPIELQVDKQLGSKKASMDVADIRKECRGHASKYIDIQREDFKRLGVFADWDNPYITMDYAYEATTLAELYKFFDNGGVYKGSKPVYWCHSCVTALAEAEVEYENHTSSSIYVKFQFDDIAKEKLVGDKNIDLSAVIWTTTPWTLPANLAIAVNKDFDYSIIKVTTTENRNLKVGEHLVLATEMLDKIAPIFFITDYEIVKTVKGSELEKMKPNHPFYNRESGIVLADYVTLEAGTGLVHTAPGHGQDDYETGLKYGLPILSPVDNHGKYKDDVELFAGVHINQANEDIVKLLESNGSLIMAKKIEHSYPHCWRCHSPVIFRATPQWFISMETNDLRAKAIDAIQNKIKFIPAWGKNRIFSMVENRPDWCISRQRIWGVPIAVFTCHDCGEIIINEDIKKRVLASFEKEGADAWFIHDEEFFLGKGFKCPKCNSLNVKKEKDILDVWFDSGTSHAAVCEKRESIGGRANLYLEGSDQHRGWFHSSLLESVGTRGVAPFDELLTHGFVVDGKGKKMSKSVGNVIYPNDIIDKYGAEILRLWVASEDYTDDVRISDDIIKRLIESYRKIRNTARYLLGNLYDFNPDKDAVEIDNMMELDKDILAIWQEIKEKIYASYNNFQFHAFYHTFLNFCINDLSAYYLDILKDRLYSSEKSSHKRRSAQTVLFILIKEISVVISPILTFTADEFWSYLPDYKDKSESVFYELFPKVLELKRDDKFIHLLNLRKEVNKALEIARRDKIIGHPLDAEVTVATDNTDILNSVNIDEGIEKFFIVSKISFIKLSELAEATYTTEDGLMSIKIIQSVHVKCERCWNYSETVGAEVAHPTICSRCVDVLGGES